MGVRGALRSIAAGPDGREQKSLQRVQIVPITESPVTYLYCLCNKTEETRN